MMETAERDPAFSDTAAILEGLIAFEGRARDLLFRRRIARIADRTMSPFLTHDGAALAADLRALEAGLPRHAIMLHDLQPALESLAGHERSVAQTRELLERATHVADARRDLLEREGRTSRPVQPSLQQGLKALA